MNGLKQYYLQTVVPELAKQLGRNNRLSLPKIEKVVVNVGVGEAASDKALLEAASQNLASLTGQKPKVCRAKKSISAFNLQEGSPIGLKVTLRGYRMYNFLEKLFKIVLPRVRDFQGVSLRGFDGRGNYTLGFPEINVFPEIEFEKTTKVKGMEVSFITSAKNNEEAKILLEKLGMPFAK